MVQNSRYRILSLVTNGFFGTFLSTHLNPDPSQIPFHFSSLYLHNPFRVLVLKKKKSISLCFLAGLGLLQVRLSDL